MGVGEGDSPLMRVLLPSPYATQGCTAHGPRRLPAPRLGAAGVPSGVSGAAICRCSQQSGPEVQRKYGAPLTADSAASGDA